MKIIGGSASNRLSEALSTELGCELMDREIKRFPDGEVYVRIKGDVKDEDVIIVQTTYPDANIIELMALQDAVTDDIGNGRLITVIPYFGYSRQDKKFNPGEAITARAMIRHLELYSDAMVLVDLHAPAILNWAKKAKTVEAYATKAIAQYMKDKDINFILSPDKGAIARAKRLADYMGLPSDYLEKTRIDGSTVKMKPKNLDVSGASVLIVDDIIATGNTIIRATEQLKNSGAQKVYAACTHGLYTGGAIPKLEAVLDGLYSSDTIESSTSRYSVASPVSESIKELLERWD